MSDITKIKVDGEPESSYQLYPRNEEFAKRAGGNGGSQSGVQSDWNQNDDTQPDYVKNRPFYTDAVETVLVEKIPSHLTKIIIYMGRKFNQRLRLQLERLTKYIGMGPLMNVSV